MLRLILLIVIFLQCNPIYAKDSPKQVSSEVKLGSLVLKDVLEAASSIADSKPSKKVAKVAGDIITVNDKDYEIRIFYFEDNSHRLDLSFYDFAKENGLLKFKSQIIDQGFGPVEFFSSSFSPQITSKGIYYLLSLRKVE